MIRIRGKKGEGRVGVIRGGKGKEGKRVREMREGDGRGL